MIARVILCGVGATLAMDLGSGAGRKLQVLKGVPLEWMQHWFGLALHGRPFVGDIRTVTEPGLPLPVVLLCHYCIGTVLATTYWLLLGPRGNLSTAMAFGLLTCALPWLFMFPSMGIGPFGVGAPGDLLLVRTSLINHLIYGTALGLLLWAWPSASAAS